MGEKDPGRVVGTSLRNAFQWHRKSPPACFKALEGVVGRGIAGIAGRGFTGADSLHVRPRLCPVGKTQSIHCSRVRATSLAATPASGWLYG